MRQLYSLLFSLLLLPFVSAQAQYSVKGSATILGPSEFKLTPISDHIAGAVWNNTPLNLTQNFDITTQLFFGVDDLGADGIAFVLQSEGTSYLGNYGAGLGYHRFNGTPFGMPVDVPGPVPSLIVEFDTYQNGDIYSQSIGDPAEDHLGFMSNSNAYHTNSTALAPPVPFAMNIEDGQWHDARFTWDASTRTLTVQFLGKTYTYTGDIINNIFKGNPVCYWGFTASCGTAKPAEHKCKIIKADCNIQPCPRITVSVPDVYAVNPGGEPNTIYDEYGPSSLTLVASATGGVAPYTYKWSTGATGSSIVVSPSAVGEYFYTVIVTDAKGCTGTKVVKVKVKSCSCGGGNKDHKVTVCHIPPGNHDNAHEICVDKHAVPAHLAHGDHLGACTGKEGDDDNNNTGGGPRKDHNDVIVKNVTPEVVASILKNVVLSPNPSRGQFSLHFANQEARTVRVDIATMSGNVVESRTVAAAKGQTVQFDLSKRLPGVYLVKLTTENGVETRTILIQR